MSEVISTVGDTEDVYLPTYRIEPDENDRLYPSMVKKVVETMLKQQITTETKFEEKEVPELSKIIADSIRHQLSEELHASAGEDGSRYKLVVQVIIGQLAGQGVRFASRCLWNATTDNYTSFSFSNDHLFCTVLVAGLYTD